MPPVDICTPLKGCTRALRCEAAAGSNRSEGSAAARTDELRQMPLVNAMRCDESYAVTLEQADRGKTQAAGADANAAQFVE